VERPYHVRALVQVPYGYYCRWRAWITDLGGRVTITGATSTIIQDLPTFAHVDVLMNRLIAASPRTRSTYVFTLNILLALVFCAAAGAAEPIHGWGLVDWGMSEAQVEAAYGDGVEKLPPARSQRTQIVESLRLRNPVVLNGISLAQSFIFSRATKGLDGVVLRANLSNVSTEQCQGAYRKIRQSEVDKLKAPIEEKPALRSLHAIWHGTAADVQLSLLDVTGRCLLTVVYRRPSPPNPPSDGSVDTQADKRSTTAPASTTPATAAPPERAP
jgi:hypothetical protein